jgi:hypothetical protein
MCGSVTVGIETAGNGPQMGVSEILTWLGRSLCHGLEIPHRFTSRVIT